MEVLGKGERHRNTLDYEDAVVVTQTDTEELINIITTTSGKETSAVLQRLQVMYGSAYGSVYGSASEASSWVGLTTRTDSANAAVTNDCHTESDVHAITFDMVLLA